MLYSPNHRARGKVPRDVYPIRQRRLVDDLEIEAAKTTTGDNVIVLSAHGPAGRERLTREIKIGSRLLLAGDAPELAPLIGFDDDSDADPQVAVVGHSGEPLADVAQAMSVGDRLVAARGLLGALAQLNAARVVHRALSPDSVLWDASRKSVQVSGFGQAAIAGESRRGGPPLGPWCGPEQASGTGAATTMDDLYSAGLLLFWLYTGEAPTPDPAAMRERLALHDEDLRRRLDGSFSDRASDRPSLEQLSRRWRPGSFRQPVVPRRDDDARREFAALRDRQRADLTPLVNPSVVLPKRWNLAGSPQAIAVLAGLAIIVVLVLAVTLG
jgi:serine/threonine protein kinase